MQDVEQLATENVRGLPESEEVLDVPLAPPPDDAQVDAGHPAAEDMDAQSERFDVLGDATPDGERADTGRDGGQVLGVSLTPIGEIICAYPWPQGCSYWIGVAECESSLRSYAVGYGEAYVGLFQVWTGHGYGYDWLLDPVNNVLAAWELSDGGAKTSPWPICRYQ